MGLKEGTEGHMAHTHIHSSERVVCVCVCVCVCMCDQSLSHVQPFATPWAVAHQVPLSMGLKEI